MKRHLVFLLLILLCCDTARSQSKTLNGVYAGLEVSLGVVMGGGMNRYDHAYLYRPDGTFSGDLGRADWKTHVSGTYQVVGDDIKMHWTNSKGSGDSYKMAKGGGYMIAGSYNLLRMSGDKAVPAGFYKFSKMNSSGGIGTTMTYVGVSSDNGLYFDGKGNFSNNRASATVVAGDGVGGGGHKESSGTGTYTLKNGVLTLNFADGRTETHSFFFRPDDDPIMAVVDGNIYFGDDKKELAKSGETNASAKNNLSNSNTSAANTTTPGTNASAADGRALLMKANTAHGGANLDNMKTVKVSSIIQGLQLTTFIDAVNNRLRVEVRQGQKLLQVRQLEDQAGWQWQGGQITQLSPADVAEMNATFYSGIMGLRKPVINRLQIVKTQQAGDKSTITCKLDGTDYIFITNAQNQLIAAGDKTAQSMSVSALTDVRDVHGIQMPFQESQSNGKQKLNIQYVNFEINPTFNSSVWAKPMGN